MKPKVASMKFILAIMASAMIISNHFCGYPVDPEKLSNLLNMVLAYITVEGLADIVSTAKGDMQPEPETVEKVRSRKTWVVVGFLSFGIINPLFPTPLPEDTLSEVFKVLATWMGVQGLQDVVKRWKTTPKNEG